MKGLHTLAGLALAAAATLSAGAAAAQGRTLAGVTCQSPPPARCAPTGCAGGVLAELGNATDAKTGRKFFLDYPCDLKPGEKVVFILNIHGAGSIANWQRHYFPAVDFKDKYRLVVATPSAATAQPMRMWRGDADDVHLQNIVDMVFEAVGKRNVKAFWLAGHSQGGLTSNRIVCTPFFKDKVDGWLSLSGGRIGPAELAPSFFQGAPAAVAGGRPEGGPPGARPGAASAPACDFNYIFTTGDKEIGPLPVDSPWAEKYGCGKRVLREEIVDDKGGMVNGGRRDPPNPAWGLEAGPGKSQVLVYPGCKGGKLVADVPRINKGHTEGLEPKVTEALIKLMVGAPGGKNQNS
jgi:hypothetical protein